MSATWPTLALLIVACRVEPTPAPPDSQANPTVQREVIQMPGALDGLPFSSAVRAGPTIYLSGQIGIDPGTGQLVEGGIGPETRQTLENIRAVLDEAESSLERVVKCTVFLADMSEYAAMNEVYATYFSGPPPARSAVAGSGLAFDARVEIECIALAE